MRNLLFSALFALLCVSAPVAQTGSLDDPLIVPIGGTIGPIPNPLEKPVVVQTALSVDGGETFVGLPLTVVQPGASFEAPVPEDPVLCDAIVRFCVVAVCPDGSLQDLGCIYYRIDC
ncbi:MAG: hypothetical protein AAF196_17850 [Planctomycetota bacterium]